MPRPGLAALWSALHACRLARAAPLGPGDEAVLVQREVSRQFPSADTCRPLPAPLHYDYGKYRGAYQLDTVFWKDEEFERAEQIGNRGATEQLVPLMQKLQRGETVKMVVFGGSSTAGANCKQGRPYTRAQKNTDDLVYAKECAWPRRFQHWLHQAFPKGKVELTNFAQGAATSSSILAGAGLMLKAFKDKDGVSSGADIIFVDTLVNDVYQTQKEWGISASEGEGRRLVDPDTNAALAFEQMLRVLHQLQPQAVIFPVLSGCSICKEHGMHHRKVVGHYNLPQLDWGDIVDFKDHLWDRSDVHPVYWYHQSLADVMAMIWGRVWRDGCSYPASADVRLMSWQRSYFKPAVLDYFQPCLEPLSAYDANVPSTTTSGVALGEGWRLFEDRPGKPGWISETPGSRMMFDVRFGKHPVLVITWMRSYQNMGIANMRLNGRDYPLHGLWTEGLRENVTLAYTRWLQVDRPSIQVGPKQVKDGSMELGVAGFNIFPHSNMTLGIEIPLDHTVQHHKMKILQVFTC